MDRLADLSYLQLYALAAGAGEPSGDVSGALAGAGQGPGDDGVSRDDAVLLRLLLQWLAGANPSREKLLSLRQKLITARDGESGRDGDGGLGGVA